MCGIAGIVSPSKPKPFLREGVRQLVDHLKHRGPCGTGVLDFNNVSIGHTRLAVVDIEGSTQPIASLDGIWSITFNGEVYNFRELRKQLEDEWVFTTDGDAEVVLAAFSRWGLASLERLNGMFAFFIWNAKQQVGWLVRDLLGVKPVYWLQSGDLIAFASEARALARCQEYLTGYSPKLNSQAVAELMLAPCFSGVTTSMFVGIQPLLSGHVLSISASTSNIKCTVNAWADYLPHHSSYHSPESSSAYLAPLLVSSVTSTLQADVPVCTFLSGGLDSTLITALAQQNSGYSVDAYTVCFPELNTSSYTTLMTGSDDTPEAVAAASDLGVRHHLVSLARRTLLERIQLAASLADCSPAWEQELSQLGLFSAASKNYKVVLVGDAADETHYGYHFLLDSQALASPSALLSRFSPPSEILSPELHRYHSNHLIKYENLANANGYNWTSHSRDRLLATSYLIVKYWLPRLLLNGDQYSMAFGVEARLPFADIHLLRAAQQVNPADALAEHTEKAWLRKSTIGMLPDRYRLRKKSALPKDFALASVYAAILKTRLAESRHLFEPYFLPHRLNDLVDNTLANNTASEANTALLFRALSFSYWREANAI